MTPSPPHAAQGMGRGAKKRSREHEGTAANDGRSKCGVHDAFFSWLLGMTQEDFFKHFFEKKPYHFSHGEAAHFTHPTGGFPAVAWSTDLMMQLMAEKELSYSVDVDVVRFDMAERRRIAFRDSGIVTAKEMRRCMQKGWSVRFLRPHEHVSETSAVVSVFENVFGCFCGLNSYWTPAGSQGFAPHYDDVDVFLLQLEGEKEWRLYDPPEPVDVLSRHSSEDYEPQQLPKPKLALRLLPGDVLYMPRGTIHQGRTFDHTHSLHVTFSANQMNTWADLIKRALMHAVETMAANHVTWRRSIPRTLLKTLGALHNPVFREEAGIVSLAPTMQQRRVELQSEFRKKVTDLFLHVSNDVIIDESCDMYARDTVAKLQPPPQPNTNAAQTKITITGNTIVRLVSPNCARLVLAFAGEARVYHNCSNSPVCLATTAGYLRFEAVFAPAIATIMTATKDGVQVSQMPFPAFDHIDDIISNQLTLAEALYDAGVIVVV